MSSSRHRQSAARPTPGRRSVVQTPMQHPAFASASTSAAVGAVELPPYRKPAHPLSVHAQDEIRALNGRSIVHVNDHHKRAEDRIAEAAALIQDRLTEREDAMPMRRKRWSRGGIDTEEQERQEERLAKMQEEVDKTTERLEESLRAVIDSGVAAQRIEDSLEWLRQTAPGQLEREYATQRSQLQSQLEEPTPGPTPLDGLRPALTGASELFADRVARKKEDYTSISLSDRYSRNNAYANFKKMVHDAKDPNGEHPVPNPDTWFTSTGSPALAITGHGAENDENDDIVMDRATISTRCPITFMQFKDPYTSTKCPHTFEKNAILEIIRKQPSFGGTRAVRCPVPGCDQMLSAGDLRKDPTLVRQIKRMQQKEAREREEEQEAEEEQRTSEQHNKRVESQNKGSSSSVLQVPSTQQPPQSSVVEDLGSSSEGDEGE